MKIQSSILILIFFCACNLSNENSEDKKNKNQNCDYIKHYQNIGNTKIDTFRRGQELIDPIDDTTSFKKAKFGFVLKENKIYKKAKTYAPCGEEHVSIEYYQDFTGRVDLNSYKKIDDTYFATNGKVYFWWVNSGGHMMIPIEIASPKTFSPFEKICGGTDDQGVYYGCPNRGVYQIEMPPHSKFEFVAKKDNYWNSPKHYLIIDDQVYDMNYDYKKGYYCELDKNKSIKEIGR